MPDFALERRAARGARAETLRIAGVDEAGRGPLAGPVVAAALVFHTHELPHALAWGLDDSKALAAAERARLYADLRTAEAEGLVEIGIGAASVAEIAARNILGASMLAMCRALARLAGGLPDLALIDGNRVPPELACPAQAVVGGDGRSLSIAAASIIAKVTRDRLMERLARRYPGFGWETNAGYPTPPHKAALRRLGRTAHHRRDFAGVADITSQYRLPLN
ncbi:MAG: ribonuclease HII [Alphaproteobacteria bacterium]|nr:ribonuclease HII [Alphaproteobacteria bacterium]